MTHALKDRHPHHVEVPLLIIASAVLLVIGLSMPLLEVEKKLLWKVWRNDYSVFTGIVNLMEQGEMFLAAILFFFGLIFPFGKLVALAVIWFVPMSETHRQKVLHWLSVLGKWSMMDVFVVSVLIVLVKLGSLVQVKPQSGVYVFGAAILVSMITNLYMERLARKA
jgi:paraquat-inducible protein A